MVEHREMPDGIWFLALLMTPGIGVVTLNRVASALKEADIPLHAVVGHSAGVLRKGLPVGLEWAVDSLTACESATVDRAAFLYDRVVKTGGHWLMRGGRGYPSIVMDVMEYGAPPLFCVYGDASILEAECLSIVGSREPSNRGVVLAEELAEWAVGKTRVVVSGGAEGIDMAAHRRTLNAGGRTCLVIPQGVLTYRGPDWLGGYMESGHACVVSHVIPDWEWSTSSAMSRNRTVAALGRLVCVIDPGRAGGSRRTGQFSLEYARRTLVYGYDKVNGGYSDLVRSGAYPLLNEHEEWDVGYIEGHWSAGCHTSGKQTDLF
jgi:predicted Rossmann fold nucleotide-binding protein DprA/Smf involved in DNA uptake